MSLRVEQREYVIFLNRRYIFAEKICPALTYDTAIFIVYENDNGKLDYLACTRETEPVNYIFSKQDFLSDHAVDFSEIDFLFDDKEELMKQLKKEYIIAKMERDLKK